MHRSVLAAAALAAVFGCSGMAFASNEAATMVGTASPAAAPAGAAHPPTSYRAAVARVSPSVVTVYSAHALKPANGSKRSDKVMNLGSGVVIGADGDIVTNYHVVQDATELAVAFVDGTVLPCRVVAFDAESDIALLHVDATGLQPISMADIGDVAPGDVVLAVGNPFGIGQAVSQGIVSAVVHRGVRPQESFIQTDAAINPGNSGGALVDATGRLVGINVLILSQSGGFEGMGFAIPVDLVQTVVAALKSRGRVARGWFGWWADEAPHGEGVRVIAVERDGPAQRAGMVPGDILVRVGERPVQSLFDAANVMIGSDPGTHVPVEIAHRGVPATLDVQLGPVPAWKAGLEASEVRFRGRAR